MSGKQRHTFYYDNHFPVEDVVHVILGFDNDIANFVSNSWISGVNVNVHIDYICMGEHRDVVHTIISPFANVPAFLNLVDQLSPTTTNFIFDNSSVSSTFTPDSVLENVKVNLSKQMRQKIKEFSPLLSEIYYTGVSVTTITNDLSQLFDSLTLNGREIHSVKIPKARIHMLDFDTPWDSDLGKEIGCSICHYEYSDFDSLNNLLFYQVGCLYNTIFLADFVYSMHTLKPPMLCEPLFASSLKSPVSNIISMSLIRRHLESWRKESMRVFFSGSKGIHTHINSDILGPEGNIYTEMEDMFSPKTGSGFSGLFSTYLRWLVKCILEELNLSKPSGPLKDNAFRNAFCGGLQIIDRLKDFVSLAKSITFNTHAMGENFTKAKMVSVSFVSTKSSIGFWIKKLCMCLNIKFDIDSLHKTLDIWEWLKKTIIDEHLINKTFNDVVGEYSSLPVLFQNLVRDFCCAFVLLNPLLVGDSAVNSVNQKLRVPFSYHNTSHMISFELPLFVAHSNNIEDVSFNALRNNNKKHWTRGRDMMLSLQ